MLNKELAEQVKIADEDELEDIAYEIGLNNRASDNLVSLGRKYQMLQTRPEMKCPKAIELIEKLKNGISKKDLQEFLHPTK